MRKAILMIVLVATLVAGLVIWLVIPGVTMDSREILMILAIVLIAGLALYMAFRRIRDTKKDLPPEDEMSKRIKKNAGATAFYISIYLWLALMVFEDKFTLDRSEFIGMGILGMSLIFGLSWVYHNYFSKNHD